MKYFVQLFALLVALVIGWGARVFGLLDRVTTKKLSLLLMNVCYPLLVISSFQQGFSSSSVGLLGTVLVIALIVHLIPTVIAFLLFRGSRPTEAAALRFCATFPSCGVVGIPLFRALFGDLGAFYGACFTLFSMVYMWTLGAFMLSAGRKGSFASCLKELLNPCVAGAIVGALVFVLRIHLPDFIAVPIGYVGGMSVPLAMIILGSMIREVPLKSIFLSADVYISAFIKLLALPLLVLLGCMILNISKWTALMNVLAAALPTTMYAPLLAERFGASKAKSTAAATVATVLSVLTVPLVMYFAGLAFNQ